jgi:hypothetical protein
MGNLSSQHFEYSDFIDLGTNGIKINGLPHKDKALIEEFFCVLNGSLVNDPINTELPWSTGRRSKNWIHQKSIHDYFNIVKSYIVSKRNTHIHIADLYNYTVRNTFTELSELTKKQLAHFYTVILLMDGIKCDLDLSNIMNKTDFTPYLFDECKIDHWFRLLSKLKTRDDEECCKKPKEKCTKRPETLEEYLDEILVKLDALHKMYYRIEKRLDDKGMF